MIILAIDPGPTFCGFAAVRSVATIRPLFLRGGKIESHVGAFEALLKTVDPMRVNVAEEVRVAVERPAGAVYDAFRGATLLGTANVAGGVAWVSRSLGMSVEEIPAQTVRKVLLGGRGKVAKGQTDRAIKEALPSFVSGMPARTNDHVRDALALAVCADFLARNLRKKAS